MTFLNSGSLAARSFFTLCVSYYNQRTGRVSVWQGCVDICLHLTVNEAEIAYRLVVPHVDERTVLGQQKGLRAETELATHTHTMP